MQSFTRRHNFPHSFPNEIVMKIGWSNESNIDFLPFSCDPQPRHSSRIANDCRVFLGSACDCSLTFRLSLAFFLMFTTRSLSQRAVELEAMREYIGLHDEHRGRWHERVADLCGVSLVMQKRTGELNARSHVFPFIARLVQAVVNEGANVRWRSFSFSRLVFASLLCILWSKPSRNENSITKSLSLLCSRTFFRRGGTFRANLRLGEMLTHVEQADKGFASHLSACSRC